MPENTQPPPFQQDPASFASDAWARSRPGIAQLIQAWIQADPSREASTLADLLAADAEERAERGLNHQLETYASEFPAVLSDIEACRAILMIEFARSDEVSIARAVSRISQSLPALSEQVAAVAELCGVMTSASIETPSEPGPGDVLGKYTLVERLGTGSFGSVWRADDRELSREVALKLLHVSTDDHFQRVMKEAQAAAAIAHPNIVSIHAAGTFSNGRAYIDAQLVGDPARAPGERALAGSPLDRPGLNISSRDAARIVLAVASGVAAAHARGVVHRDIKPANIILTPSGTPMLADFGLSVLGQSHSGRVSGTPAFMPPEQARGEPATPATDIYSLGATLRYLLTGSPPITPSAGSTNARQEVLDRVRNGKITPLESLGVVAPRTLVRICDRAMEPSVANRYPSAGHLADDLARWLSNHPTSAGKETATKRVALWYRRNIASATVGLVAFVALAVGGERSIREIRHQRDDAIAARAEADVHAREADEARALAVARERQATDEAQISKGVNRFMQEALVAAQANLGGRSVTMYDAIVAASSLIDATVTKGSEVEAGVRHVVGRVLGTMGEFKLAEPNLSRSLELRRELLGKDHPDTLVSEFSLAEMLSYAERTGDAAAIIVPLEARVAEILGETHELRLACRDALAQVRLQQGKLNLARSLIRANIDARLAAKTPDELKIAAGESQLGELAKESGQRETAISLFESAIARYTRILSPDSINIAGARNDLGSVFAEMGNVERAEPLLREAFATFSTKLGAKHVNTFNCGYNLAWMLLTKKKAPDDSLAIIEVVRPNAVAMLGQDNIVAIRCTILEARALTALRRFEDAEPVLRAAIPHAEALGAAGLSLDSVASRTLAECLTALGKTDEASTWKERADRKRAELQQSGISPR